MRIKKIVFVEPKSTHLHVYSKVTIPLSPPPCYRLADAVRAAGIPVVLGGTHVTFISDEGLEHGDYLVRGEGEQAIVELVEALEGKRDVRTIPGLSYWRDGEKVHNPD